MNETEVRVIIDDMLKKAGWRLPGMPSPNVRMEQRVVSDSRNRAADYVLLNNANFPLAVLEAKKSGINPLEGKEQARQYAQTLQARFVILSNGELHYFWDSQEGNPSPVQTMPSPESLAARQKLHRRPQSFAEQTIGEDYIAQTQGAQTPPEHLRHLRNYQLDAVRAVQNAAAAGRQRFLLEMATGTGKTLISAAIIKLYLRSSNAQRVLFLVDRLELEEQAQKNMKNYVGNDYESVIYKQNKDDWNRAHIVISTVQSLAYEDRYRKKFSPLDFDLLVVDEAHRAICGRGARGVFEYFIGHKVGLTATPRDYLRGVSEEELQSTNPKELELRRLRDTYTIFGGESVFRYDLQKGVEDNFLLSPTLIDARTEITTELLSGQGVTFQVDNETGDTREIKFTRADYERKLFSPATARAQCRAFLEHARTDPMSGEIGKSIVYCVSQNHAAKTAQVLNELAHEIWPGTYRADFALQVTSRIPDAQECTRRFAYNNLNGWGKFLENYRTSTTRVCVTVGMMTTGYDCPDILNLCLLRPIFSPSEFVQIKGRGTRRHTFTYRSEDGEEHKINKDGFSLFDFFAVCEYFEKEHVYDDKLSLTDSSAEPDIFPDDDDTKDSYVYEGTDTVRSIKAQKITPAGTRADRELLRAELLKQETGKFVAAVNPDDAHVMDAAAAFKAYLSSSDVREKIDNKQYGALSGSAELTDEEWTQLPKALRRKIVRYVRDYVDLGKFAA
ncbi:MAG: DEAD/DEAH box helicase family protein [Salinispira sp.]